MLEKRGFGVRHINPAIKCGMSFPTRLGIHFPTTPLDSRFHGNDMKGDYVLFKLPV